MHRGSLMATFATQQEQRTAEAAGALNGQPLIDLAQIKKAYRTPAGDVYALNGVDLKVEQGEFVGIVGKSGAGKSTLVNMVTGIDKPTSGRIRVGAQAVHAMSEDQVAGWRGKNVGVIFQFFQLLPMLTVVQNVMLPMDFAGLYNSTREQRERALHLLEQVEIAEHADKLPSAVSGGQRQRVAIARAVVMKPSILLADEPTGNLDTTVGREVIAILERMNADGLTLVLVSHDPEIARRARRRIGMLDGSLTEESGREEP